MTTKKELIEKYCSVTPLSEELKDDRRPIVLYGTGNGADKIIRYLESLGRTPDAVFASDGFVRDRSFAGFPVETFDAVSARYGKDMKILMCFGSDREEVLGAVERLDSEYDLALPDVPLYGDGIFNKEYLYSRADELFEVRAMLSDEPSRKLFDDTIMYRLTGKYRFLLRTQSPEATYRELFEGIKVECAVDCGAYRGDTARLFEKVFPDCRRIYALEPDRGTFKRLELAGDEISLESGIDVVTLNFAISDAAGIAEFSSSSSRGAGVEGTNRRSKRKTVEKVTLDSLALESPDFIKLDVEGDEERALAGAKRLLSEHSPSLAVSLYHRTDDIRRLPLLIKKASAAYGSMKYYLRRPRCVPAWDLTLYAVREK